MKGLETRSKTGKLSTVFGGYFQDCVLWLSRQGAEGQGRFAQALQHSGVICWDETEAGRLWEGGHRVATLVLHATGERGR